MLALTPKAARYLEKRPYAPGEHGRTKRKADSDYAVRLREKQRLRAQYGKDLSTEFKVSPELLGGLRIKVGSDVIDGSVRERLNRLEAQLTYA